MSLLWVVMTRFLILYSFAGLVSILVKVLAGTVEWLILLLGSSDLTRTQLGSPLPGSSSPAGLAFERIGLVSILVPSHHPPTRCCHSGLFQRRKVSAFSSSDLLRNQETRGSSLVSEQDSFAWTLSWGVFRVIGYCDAKHLEKEVSKVDILILIIFQEELI